MDNMETENVMNEQEFLNDNDIEMNQMVGDSVSEGAISEVDNQLGNEEMEKMNDTDAFNRDLYENMEANMNQPSPLYEDEYGLDMMLESNEENSNNDLDQKPRNL